jgi:hypothetical protein
VLATPILGKELIMYTTALDGSLGALLAQENQDDNQNTLYYLGHMMVGTEHGHLPINHLDLQSGSTQVFDDSTNADRETGQVGNHSHRV